MTPTDQRTALSALHEKWKIPPADMVGKLPKGKNEGEKRSCKMCGGFHPTNWIHLDYMGHADVTEVLLREDPLWDWEPCAFNENGPVITKTEGGSAFWIRLTVHGKTRLGVGTLDKAGSAKESAPKELLGDGLRNAAMKFGIGLSLWSKSEWQTEPTEDEVPAASRPTTSTDPTPSPRVVVDSTRPFVEGDPLEGHPAGPIVVRVSKLSKENRSWLSGWCTDNNMADHAARQSVAERVLYLEQVARLENA